MTVRSVWQMPEAAISTRTSFSPGWDGRRTSWRCQLSPGVWPVSTGAVVTMAWVAVMLDFVAIGLAALGRVSSRTAERGMYHGVAS